MWKYKGIGFIAGIPARDITESDFANFSKRIQDIIKTCGLYELVKVKETK